MNILGCCLIVAAQLTINVNTKIAVLLFIAGNFLFGMYFLRERNIPQAMLNWALFTINITNLFYLIASFK